eukprot:scaffold911_cov125-Skeletonema_dohrnii-CCMP3373.AAC.9
MLKNPFGGQLGRKNEVLLGCSRAGVELKELLGACIQSFRALHASLIELDAPSHLLTTFGG